MTLTPDRLEEIVTKDLDASGHSVTLKRPLVVQMLALLKEQRAEIERLKELLATTNNAYKEVMESNKDAARMCGELRAENRRLRSNMAAEREEVARRFP
jgi:hypothetical protein